MIKYFNFEIEDLHTDYSSLILLKNIIIFSLLNEFTVIGV